MGRLFGTDGVRGLANHELTAELALALGSAAARRLVRPGHGNHRVAVVGRDPRASGEMLEAAVIAGLTSEGVDALRVGVLPTPAVAYLTHAYDAEFGVMISGPTSTLPVCVSTVTTTTTTPSLASTRRSRSTPEPTSPTIPSTYR